MVCGWMNVWMYLAKYVYLLIEHRTQIADRRPATRRELSIGG
jgi:hypothetical protein